MREENTLENPAKVLRFADQNQMPRARNARGNGHSSKLRSASSWGSHIVKGLTADKKTKVLTTTVHTKKVPLSGSDVSNQKNQSAVSHSRVKRSLIGDLSCSANSAQVYPQLHQTHRRQGSRDLFVELDQLRGLLQESKEREFKLQAELTECKRNPKVLDLEREVEVRKSEIDEFRRRVELLECEKRSLSGQLSSVPADEALRREDCESLAISSCPPDLGMEVLELRRLNKELQLQKRSLACRLSTVESQLATLAKGSESDIVAKIKAEASLLRHTNEDLCKQVEGLQMSRLNEVEELAYLRWVNSCLRNELRNTGAEVISDRASSPDSGETDNDSISSLSCQSSESVEYSNARRVSLIKKFKKWPLTGEELSNRECPANNLQENWFPLEEERSPRRHSISGLKCSAEDIVLNKRRQSDGFMCSKENEKGMEPLMPTICEWGLSQRPQFYTNCQETSKLVVVPFEVEKRTLRIPNPPPRPSCTFSTESKKDCTIPIPAPPPPPPPPPPSKLFGKGTGGAVRRAPQVVEFYHSLMKRDSRKDSLSGGACDASDVANVRSSMIGEIENRSSHLLAIKADVEVQGEFVNSLIREVNNAVYENIEDVVAFVKWLDDELCFLVDERAVLKHFDWPEKKADTLREAAFGYRDLKKLESEVCHYKDDLRIPCDVALKKMVNMSEKMERTIYNLLRTRESLMRNCKECQIPVNWMLDNGIISKIKIGSVKLAQKYMKRVAMELQLKATADKDPAMDYMLLQGVRFAFRIHQFAGGFDSETMQAFEELRNLANLLNKK
ncbi:uncharacterized protein J3R85_012804 [Psidium guajava]|nr:uncharacterized protein J3R85_012804 [Psidium guajava]